MRIIDIANSKNRNAEVFYFSPALKRKILFVTDSGEKTHSQKILKTTTSTDRLLKAFGTTTDLAEALISSDPEIDMEMVGQLISSANKVYVNEKEEVVHKVIKKEFVYNTEGALLEERAPKYLSANIKETTPVKGSKLFPKKEIFNKFIFARKYQVRHRDGLTYDFLFSIAQELHEKDSLMFIGAGAKGIEPLVFEDGGKPFRAFLEGKVEGSKYMLIMHLSNLELKALPKV
jgi:hypothetical protein